jgi:hypothetical protein
MVSQSFNSKLTQKLRLITKKVSNLVKPLLTKRHNKKTTSNQKAEPMTPVNRSWMHPSQLKSSEYVDCCQHEADENALNEALEAKLRQLIVTEYANRRTISTAPVSLHIQGHLTITPTQQEGTFWTTSSSSSSLTADADICWRDCSVVSQPQKAERQTPLLY